MHIYYGCHVMAGSVLKVSSILINLVESMEPRIAGLFTFVELPLTWITTPYSSSNISNSSYCLVLYLCLPLPTSKRTGFL